MTSSPRLRGCSIACIVGAGLSASSAPAWSRSVTAPAPGTPAEQPVADASGPAQFYVLSFTDAPVTEVIDAVVGGALGQVASVDAAIDGTMSFRAEGWFSPDALLAEFGSALLDQELAMVRSAAGDLAVVPRSDIAPELARGAVLVSSAASPVPGAAAGVAAAGPAAPIVYGEARWQDGPAGALLIFLAGCAAGAGALAAGTLVRRRLARRTPAAALLKIAYAPPPPRPAPVEDPDLVIPCFDAPRPPLAR